jgi:hypothetical protein
MEVLVLVTQTPLDVAKFLSRLALLETGPDAQALRECKTLLAESDVLGPWLVEHDSVAIRFAVIEDCR